MNEKLRFVFLSLLVVLFQSTIKIIGVIYTQSLGFLSETVDTLVDIFFVSLTLYSIHLSQRPADFEHMYGHEKIDSLGAILQGLILTMIYGILIFNAIQAIVSQSGDVENPAMGFQLLLVSIIVNFTTSQVLIWQGKKKGSLSLRMQGLNLFQDSLRAILILFNFILILFFDIESLDPYFSITLSIIIIITALNILKQGIDGLIDVNPLSAKLILELKERILSLPHVNAVYDVKVRSAGNTLFVEVHLAVEDFISIAQAEDISKVIRPMIKRFFPTYDVETIIEMNPMTAETSLSRKIVNLIHSLKEEYPDILSIQDLNIFQIEKKYLLSLVILVNDTLTLNSAHQIVTEFETQLKTKKPLISRIISHIESKDLELTDKTEEMICKRLNSQQLEETQMKIEQILKSQPSVKGYHGFEYWDILNFCIIEVHLFFEGSHKISTIHRYTSELENLIKDSMEIDNLKQVIIHAEPLEGRSDGKLF
ncbi:MAG: conserved membrane protein of unknown function [Promethearchaeota archaeon]|nr:MAG: conserved membrane protein of unknown function [Candidatus Lokiarchaeota archaeon]